MAAAASNSPILGNPAIELYNLSEDFQNKKISIGVFHDKLIAFGGKYRDVLQDYSEVFKVYTKHTSILELPPLSELTPGRVKLQEVFPNTAQILVQPLGEDGIIKLFSFLKKDNEIIDVGSGRGGLRAVLDASGYKTTGIDPNPESFCTDSPIFMKVEHATLDEALPRIQAEGFGPEKKKFTLCMFCPPYEEVPYEEGGYLNGIPFELRTLKVYPWDQACLITASGSAQAGGVDLDNYLYDKDYIQDGYGLKYSLTIKFAHTDRIKGLVLERGYQDAAIEETKEMSLSSFFSKMNMRNAMNT